MRFPNDRLSAARPIALRGLLLVSLASLSVACGDPTDGDALPEGCREDIGRFVASRGRAHVPDGTRVEYADNPPTSGTHAQSPLPYGVYRTAQPRERWVHSLEHGAVVLLYNCVGGCDADRDALEAIHDATAPDETGRRRIIVAPDTQMPRRFAALAWEWTLELDEVDAAQIECFIRAHKGKAPENL